MVVRVTLGDPPNAGELISQNVVESVQWFFEPRRESSGREATLGQAALASFDDVDVFGIDIEPKGPRPGEVLFRHMGCGGWQ